MLFSFAPRRLMAHLALLAMVLLLAVPTAGRIAKAAYGAMPHAATLTALCTAAGLKLVPGLLQVPIRTPQPESPAPHHPGQDCDYCPLLASTIVLFAAITLALAFCRRTDVPDGNNAGFAPFLYPAGLGARGPPVLL